MLSTARRILKRVRVHKLGFRPDVQGLRAVAVVAVVLYHAGVPGVTGGYIGVDVFFVISGFLITAHILKDMVENGRVQFAQFYARRILRILPASIFVLVVSMISAVIFVPPLLLPEVFKEGAFTAFYAPNFLFASQEVDYLSNPNPSIFQHYWSLGVEEQFYLVWPAALMLVYLLARRTAKRMAVGLAVIFVASLIASLVVINDSQPAAFFMMSFRVWEFALGGLLALLATTTSFELGPKTAALARWVGLAGITIGAVAFSDATQFPGVAAALPVVATGLVILAGTRHGTAEGTSLSSGVLLLTATPVVFLGTVSYSIYLVHWPLLVIPQIAAGDHNPLPLWVNLVIAALCVPAAWVVYRWIETPFRQLRFPPTRILAATAVITSLVVAGSFTGQYLSNHIVLHTDAIAPALIVQENPVENPVVPANMSPSIRDASDSIPEVYTLGCHLNAKATKPTPCEFGDDDSAPHVILFGDSHAAQWVPALTKLARRGDIRLTTHTKNTCSLFTSGSDPSCDIWGDQVVAIINTSPPDLVLISAYPGDQEVQVTPETWGVSVESALSAFKSEVPIAVITDTPQFNMSPAACLSRNLNTVHACGTTPRLALSQPIADAQERAADRQDAAIVDLTSYFCTPDWCPVVVSDSLMYRDAHHVSTEYVSRLLVPLWERLTPLLK